MPNDHSEWLVLQSNNIVVGSRLLFTPYRVVLYDIGSVEIYTCLYFVYKYSTVQKSWAIYDRDSRKADWLIFFGNIFIVFLNRFYVVSFCIEFIDFQNLIFLGFVDFCVAYTYTECPVTEIQLNKERDTYVENLSNITLSFAQR